MPTKNRQELETVKVGWVQKAHGIAGEIYVRLYHPRPDWLTPDGLRSLTLRSPCGLGSKYSVVGRVRPHKEGLIVGCQGVRDRDQAQILKGYSVEILRSCLVGEEEGEMYLNEVLHCEVIVKDRGVIGRVEAFVGHKAQDLLVVQGPEYNYEIPFVDEYIEEICIKSSQIYMKLPEGLLELYET